MFLVWIRCTLFALAFALGLKRAGSTVKCSQAQAHILRDLTQILIPSVVSFSSLWLCSNIIFALWKRKSSFAKQQPCIGNISSRASTLSSKTEIALMAKSQNGALLLLQTHTHNTHTHTHDSHINFHLSAFRMAKCLVLSRIYTNFAWKLQTNFDKLPWISIQNLVVKVVV